MHAHALTHRRTMPPTTRTAANQIKESRGKERGIQISCVRATGPSLSAKDRFSSLRKAATHAHLTRNSYWPTRNLLRVALLTHSKFFLSLPILPTAKSDDVYRESRRAAADFVCSAKRSWGFHCYKLQQSLFPLQRTAS